MWVVETEEALTVHRKENRMTSEYKKRCSTEIVMRSMQKRQFCAPIRSAKITKLDHLNID